MPFSLKLKLSSASSFSFEGSKNLSFGKGLRNRLLPQLIDDTMTYVKLSYRSVWKATAPQRTAFHYCSNVFLLKSSSYVNLAPHSTKFSLDWPLFHIFHFMLLRSKKLVIMKFKSSNLLVVRKKKLPFIQS